MSRALIIGNVKQKLARLRDGNQGLETRKSVLDAGSVIWELLLDWLNGTNSAEELMLMHVVLLMHAYRYAWLDVNLIDQHQDKKRMADLGKLYKDYLQAICLSFPPPNWLKSFVHPQVIHNSRPLGIQQYQDLITTNIAQPNTHINAEKILVVDDHVSARLVFTVPPTCTSYLGYDLKPAKDRICYNPCGLEDESRRGDGTFDVYGNVIYKFAVDESDGKWKIMEVWSVADLGPVKENSR